MTESLIDQLLERLDGVPLPSTNNSERNTPVGRDGLERAYRDKVRTQGSILRALLEAERRRSREDNTIVPPLPMEPTPTPEPDRWRWLVSSLKASIVGASLTLHLLEGAVLTWLALHAIHG